MQNTAVKLSFNKYNLAQHLRNSFTDKYKVLSELAQNARRAGATYVAFEYNEVKARLIVADNGKGISNFQALFAKAESQWDQAVMEMDEPYGMGFLSAIYAAEHITIESNKQKIEFTTDDALNFNDLFVQSGTRIQGTRITLEGIKLDEKQLRIKLMELAKGFPIDVKFNSESLERPHALANMVFMETAIGHVHVRNYDDVPKGNSRIGTDQYVAYLQGIEILSTRIDTNNINVIHLDPKQFKGRAPDRDVLVNQDDVKSQIGIVIVNLWQQRLINWAAKTPQMEVAMLGYTSLKYWDCLGILDHNPYLPNEVLLYLNNYPVANNCDWRDYGERHYAKKLVHRDEVESGEVTIVSTLDVPCADESFHHHMYLYRKKVLMLDGRLGSKHWLYNNLIDVDAENVRVEIRGAAHDSYYSGNDVGAPVVLCESVLLTGPLGEVEVKDEAFLLEKCFFFTQGYPLPIHTGDMNPYSNWASSLLLVPRGEEDGDVVRQCSIFSTEYDDHRESDEDDEITLFQNFLTSQRLGGEINLLTKLLNQANADQYECLRDKRFTVSFINDDNRSRIHIELA